MFKHDLTTPVIALAPMDGVSDAPYRFITKKYGNPDLVFTEFTNVTGLIRGAERLFTDFVYDEIERPVIAQLFGPEPLDFYHAAKVVVALGFDGVDINMGCPVRTVAEKGSGAALIRTPEVAKEIVRQVKLGVHDYFQDQKLTGIKEKVLKLVADELQKHPAIDRAKQAEKFTVSVKTRIGYDHNVVEEWMHHLAEVQPDWISLHGRTLKQLYSGNADWDAIASAVQALANTGIPLLANGDVTDSNRAVDILNHTQAQGLLIGRGSYGNPWIFRSGEQIKHKAKPVVDYLPSWDERRAVIIEHAQRHWDLKGPAAFVQMRKHLANYIHGIERASALRQRLMLTNNPAEVAQVLYSDFD